MVKHRDIFEFINEIAPYRDAEEWDPTGPTLGWLDDQTEGAVLSLDLTSDSYRLAKANNCNLIITHHPFIFSPLKQFVAEDFEQSLLLELAARRISVISCHTNLDVAVEGVATSFIQAALNPDSYFKDFKILIPNELKPTVGHGRIVILKENQKLSDLLQQVEYNLKTSVQVNLDQNLMVNKLAFTPGSFDESWIPQLEQQEVDLLITGEIKHHVGVMLKERKIAMFAAGHGASEQTVIPLLHTKLSNKFFNINFVENPGITYNQLRSE
ncbi:MAG: Nif3-like dinuclear metal center hexameric protein [Clostridiaceae bacterium]|nr:Nif3-like dinuclear metal center hexameric protein [Clostridiaceae bacterium]